MEAECLMFPGARAECSRWVDAVWSLAVGQSIFSAAEFESEPSVSADSCRSVHVGGAGLINAALTSVTFIFW